MRVDWLVLLEHLFVVNRLKLGGLHVLGRSGQSSGSSHDDSELYNRGMMEEAGDESGEVP